MASEPDDNPFARSSAWPKMPQAPFKVGPLPKAAPTPEPEAEPPPRTITPAFVRPVSSQTFTGLTGGAMPSAAPPRLQRPAPGPSAPAIAAAPVAPAAAPPPIAPVAASPEPAAPPQPYVEVAPVVVQPLGTSARRKPKRSPLPAIAATVAGLAAIAGVTYALNRGQDAALKGAATPAAPAASVAAAPPTTVATPTPTPPPAVADVADAPPPAVQTPAAPRVVQRASAPIAKARARAPATQPVAAAPVVISLPPAPAVAVPAPAPLPSYTPPAAPDPNAPMTTRKN